MHRGRKGVLQTCLNMQSHVSTLLPWKQDMQPQMLQETSGLHPLASVYSKLQLGRSVRKQMS